MIEYLALKQFIIIFGYHIEKMQLIASILIASKGLWVFFSNKLSQNLLTLKSINIFDP